MAEANFADDASLLDDNTIGAAPPDNRRGARQLALQVLYWTHTSPGEAESAIGQLAKRFGLSNEVRDFAAQLVAAAQTHNEQLDELVDEGLRNWKRERLARIDSLILRLALAEIVHVEATPVRVAISEAVELAKIYSGSKAYSFVNGVLDAAVRRRGLSFED